MYNPKSWQDTNVKIQWKENPKSAKDTDLIIQLERIPKVREMQT